MSGRPGARAAAWFQSIRLPSQGYIALPLVLGQALAHAAGHPFAWAPFALAQLFGLLDQWFIVWANDVADEATDRLNHTATPFSGGSRVLVEGRLDRPALVRAARLAGAGCVLVAGVLTVMDPGRWPLLVLAPGALLLLWAYSFPPLALSYRGGGELLQALGTACVLPVFGYVAQARTLEGFDPTLALVLLPSHVGCAIATTLPDEPSDRTSAKRTTAVSLGQRSAGVLVALLTAASPVAVLLFTPGYALEPAWLAVPLCASLGVLILDGARPGTLGLSARVFLGILSALSFEAVILASLLRGPG